MRYENHFLKNSFPYKESLRNVSAPFMRHCHKEFEIFHVRKGSLRLILQQEIYELSEGEIVIIPPYTVHATIPNISEAYERLVIVLDIGMFSNASTLGISNMQLYQEKIYSLESLSRHWPTAVYSEIKGLIYKMHEEYERQENVWEFAIAAYANLLMLTILRSLPQREKPYAESGDEIQAFQKVIAYIADNYGSRITLDECAKICALSPTYFSKYFKKHMGVTFQDFIKNSRIEQAKWLLLSGDTRITDIAFQCGFSSVNTFNQIFKQETGLTASCYRKAGRQG